METSIGKANMHHEMWEKQMKKAEELYMKHVYTMGGSEDSVENQVMKEVTINEVGSFRSTQKTWKDRNTSEILPDRSSYGRPNMSKYGTGRTGEIPSEDKADTNYRGSRDGTNSHSVNRLPRGSYTQIMVNPTQLSDREFMAWMDCLVEARRNRQNNKPRPYTQFRRPYAQKDSDMEHPNLRNKIKPARELNTEEIMAHMRCEYVDIEEAVEMYNLDIEECRSA